MSRVYYYHFTNTRVKVFSLGLQNYCQQSIQKAACSDSSDLVGQWVRRLWKNSLVLIAGYDIPLNASTTNIGAAHL